MDKTQIIATKNYGIDIRGRPRAMSMNLLRDQDIIVVVADNVPREIFNVPESESKMYKYRKKVIFWKISDVAKGKSVKRNNKIIKKIDKLNRQLEKKYGKG